MVGRPLEAGVTATQLLLQLTVALAVVGTMLRLVPVVVGTPGVAAAVAADGESFEVS